MMNEHEDTLEVTISARGLSVKVAGPLVVFSAIVALTLLGVLYFHAAL